MTTTLSAPAESPWIAIPRPNGRTRVRLFCFPYAGGGASAFYHWHDELPNYVEICSIQLPGRESRASETPFTHLPPLVDSLADAVRPFLDKPFVFFGHSMGAILGFEVARHFRMLNGPAPLHLFASGSRAPQIPERRPTYDLPEPELIEKLRKLNGTPEEALNHPQWRKTFLPLVRADLEVDETYEYQAEPPLDVPITVLGGAEDSEASLAELDAWRLQTNSAFSLRMFPGGHFFLRTERKSMLRAISAELASIAARILH